MNGVSGGMDTAQNLFTISSDYLFSSDFVNLLITPPTRNRESVCEPVQDSNYEGKYGKKAFVQGGSKRSGGFFD